MEQVTPVPQQKGPAPASETAEPPVRSLAPAGPWSAPGQPRQGRLRRRSADAPRPL